MKKWHSKLERNLIAGIALGVLVVECSGAVFSTGGGSGGSATNIFLIQGTNTFIQTNGPGVWTINTAIPAASTTTYGLSSTNQYILSTRYPATYRSTPVLGWNPWNTASVNNNESNTMAVIDTFITNGWRDLGYKYIVIDDGWAAHDRSANHLVPDPVKFPNGLTGIAAHCRTNGLFFGLYTETGPGRTSSDAQPSSYGYYDQDCQDFASWGVNYIKVDGIDDNSTTAGQEWNHSAFSASANRYIPGVILEMGCFSDSKNWPFFNYNTTKPGFLGDITNYANLFQWVDYQTAHYSVYGNGRWPHLLIVQSSESGSPTWCKAHASMAAMMSACYFLSDASMLGSQFFTNREIIELNQDLANNCCEKIYSNSLSEIYQKRVAAYPNSKVFALVNRSGSPVTGTINWSGPFGGVATVRDLWSRSPVAYATNSWSTNLISQDTVVVRVDPGRIPPFPYGTNYLSDFAWMPVWTNSYDTNVPVTSNYNFQVMINKSQGSNTLALGGTNYSYGLGFCATAELSWFLGGQVTSFSFTAGIDDEIGSGSGKCRLDIYTNGVLMATTADLVSHTSYWTTNLDLTGAMTLKIRAVTTHVDGTDSGNHVDLVNPIIGCPYPGSGTIVSGSSNSVITASSGVLIKSNTVASIPALTYGDNYYWNSNGVAYLITLNPAGTRTTNSVQPNFAQAFYKGNYIVHPLSLTGTGTGSWISTTTGSGSISGVGTREISIGSGGTANSVATVYNGNTGTGGNVGMCEDGAIGNRIDWAKPFTVVCSFSDWNTGSLSTSGCFRVSTGNDIAVTSGTLASRGIGFEITNSWHLYVIRHDGTSLTRTDTGSTITHAQFNKHTAQITSDGAGNVLVWLDGAYVGSYTGGPSSAGSNDNRVQTIIEANNGTDSANNLFYVYRLAHCWGQWY